MQKIHKLINSLDNTYTGRTEWTRGDFVAAGGMGVIYDAKSDLNGSFVLKLSDGSGIYAERTIYLKHLTDKLLSAAEKTFGHSINLPRLIDSGRRMPHNLYFIVLEKFAPFTYTQLSDSTFHKLVKDILHGLKYLHSRGLCHCDIKTSNILVKNKDFYLGDFGVTTKAVNSYNVAVNRDKYVDGTLEYVGRDMHITGNGPSFRTDLDNLIFCMVEWAGGILPWDNTTANTIAYDRKKAFLDKPVIREVHGYKRKVIKLFAKHALSLDFESHVDFDKLCLILDTSMSKSPQKTRSPSRDRAPSPSKPRDLMLLPRDRSPSPSRGKVPSRRDRAPSPSKPRDLMLLPRDRSPSPSRGKVPSRRDRAPSPSRKKVIVFKLRDTVFKVLPVETPTHGLEAFVHDGRDWLLDTSGRRVLSLPTKRFTMAISGTLMILEPMHVMCTCGGLSKVSAKLAASTDPKARDAYKIGVKLGLW